MRSRYVEPHPVHNEMIFETVWLPQADHSDTLLHVCQSHDVLMQLIRWGCDVNAVNWRGVTAFSHVCALPEDHEDWIETIFRMTMNFRTELQPDLSGNPEDDLCGPGATPLLYAVMSGNAAVAQVRLGLSVLAAAIDVLRTHLAYTLRAALNASVF